MIIKDEEKYVPLVLRKAKERLQTMEKEILKRTREMEMHLKVKEKMFAEMQNIQKQLDDVMKEYKIVSQQLEQLRNNHNTTDEDDDSAQRQGDESD
ncbi:hypothetical protein RFI_07012 [Reticulomyxa filosa]|uniref:Uncharacterized protein n=1 Tax=Reticulomyxa filosa TaxID=46433 RepID=X6NWA5_RETFI|nr:hypothetical protein RFI_07012 [Reticulomyxa filosa]|eukprot:ETO30109.1 hypothetical protein RFI_07012 [Reticulomyxa filosa]